MDGNAPAQPDVIWEGHPWVDPGLVAVTVECVLLATLLLLFELAFLGVGPLVVEGSMVLVGLLWVVSAGKLELLALSNRYSLKRSSLEIERGILKKNLFTVSAAGFSDLEVTRSLAGRILNTGDIVIETDSRRDLSLVRVRDPIRVSGLIRNVMTVPLVRIEGDVRRTSEGGGG